ncbi:MAG: aspartate--tRNA ligase [Clostridia bacterium]|nr:aspartate--tRNA ligase [Clostridia bacterium]
MLVSNSFGRTNMCGEVTAAEKGKKVVLLGWVQRRRDLGSLIFLWLRDRTGIVQVVFDSARDEKLLNVASDLRSEYVIKVSGNVELRDEKNINRDLKTGEIEVIAEEIEILNKSETPPFGIEDETVSETLRLQYRYLDLRREKVRSTIMKKAQVASSVRSFLDKDGFIDIETPILTKSTPEGARDYLVPSRIHESSFYALPQSPQLFKQLLMVAGFDKYYQLARCFRDEDLRADRQPEFTQIDMEMSFVDMEDVISVNERLLKHVFRETMDMEIEIPFRRLTFKDAMETYGSDKPDTRFDMKISIINDLVEKCGFKVFTDACEAGGTVCAINASQAGFSRKEIDKLADVAKLYGAKGLAWIAIDENEVRSPIAKFLSEEEIKSIIDKLAAKAGDIILIVADEWERALNAMGQLRLEVARKLNLIDNDKYNFLWVVDFPLLEYNEEQGRYTAKHHPFCSPMDEDFDLLETAPEKVRAKAYDIVLNGNEIGGGSIRIHKAEVQEKVFEALGFTKEQANNQFGFLLNAFKYGTPPHGGLAYGLDRMIMVMTKSDNIRDAIAFPKIKSAACLMTDAPSLVSEAQLDELGIAVVEKKKG